VKINQALDPFSSIRWGGHELGMFNPPALHFDQRQTTKISHFKHPGKVGNLLGLDLLRPIRLKLAAR
jgi:hypothetical protein